MGFYRRLSSLDRLEVASQFKSGVSMKRLASVYDVHVNTIKNILDENKVEWRLGHKYSLDISIKPVCQGGMRICPKCRGALPLSYFTKRSTYCDFCTVDSIRDHYFRNKYGITLAQYRELYDRQGGLCRICRHPNTNGKYLAVDHDHKDNHVRGLLCDGCNRALGFVADDIEVLLNMVEYLKADKRTRFVLNRPVGHGAII